MQGVIKRTVRGLATRIFKLLKSKLGYVPPERLFKHLHFMGPFDISLPNGEPLTLYSWGNRVENELAWRGWDGHEPHERRCWATMVLNARDILDIGANTGTFAFTAKGLNPDSRVFAFEPIQRVAEKTRGNVSVSGLDVTVVESAVARERGNLPIYDPGGENVYSASLDAQFIDTEKESYLVPVISIDEFCALNNADPEAIKLDVEGYEGEVLCGAQQLLARGRCVILCEWLGASKSHSEAQSILEACDYLALDVVQLEEVTLSETKSFEERNVVLVHRDRAQAFVQSLTTMPS
ncbi:MAG: FkbM family methyltransferase [Pseudomonadota bacterium]